MRRRSGIIARLGAFHEYVAWGASTLTANVDSAYGSIVHVRNVKNAPVFRQREAIGLIELRAGRICGGVDPAILKSPT